MISQRTYLWVAILLAVAAILLWQTTTFRLRSVCILAQKARTISTPEPPNKIATFIQGELPEAKLDYPERQLWLWQQYEGRALDRLCS